MTKSREIVDINEQVHNWCFGKSIGGAGHGLVLFFIQPNPTQHDRVDLKSNQSNPIISLNPTQWVGVGWFGLGLGPNSN